MAIGHVLYCYRPGVRGDRALREVCRLASRVGAELTVAVVRDTRPVARGCCGMAPAKWTELLDDVDADDARRAEEIAQHQGARARVVILAGEGTAELIRDYADAQACDAIAVPVRALRRGNPLPRRTMRRVKALAPCAVVELG